MAFWLVIHNFENADRAHSYRAGDKISDAEVPVAMLIAEGLCAIPHVAAMDALIANLKRNGPEALPALVMAASLTPLQAYDPATPGDWTVPPTAIPGALDAVAALAKTTDTLAQATDALATADSLRTDYALAVLTSPHQADESAVFDAYVPLAGDATQADANNRAESLRAMIVAHLASVGTPGANGAHLAADAGNSATLEAIPAVAPGALLAVCITLVNGLHAALLAHAVELGVHHHDDLVGGAATMTNTPPTTLPEVITDLNDIVTNWIAHTEAAVTAAGGTFLDGLDPANWASAVPATPADAFNRIAALLKTLNTNTAIP